MNSDPTTDAHGVASHTLLGVRGRIGNRRVTVIAVQGMDIGSQILPEGWIQVDRECRHPKSWRMTRIFHRQYFSPNAIGEGPPRSGSNSPKDVIGGSSPPTC